MPERRRHAAFAIAGTAVACLLTGCGDGVVRIGFRVPSPTLAPATVPLPESVAIIGTPWPHPSFAGRRVVPIDDAKAIIVVHGGDGPSSAVAVDRGGRILASWAASRSGADLLAGVSDACTDGRRIGPDPIPRPPVPVPEGSAFAAAVADAVDADAMRRAVATLAAKASGDAIAAAGAAAGAAAIGDAATVARMAAVVDGAPRPITDPPCDPGSIVAIAGRIAGPSAAGPTWLEAPPRATATVVAWRTHDHAVGSPSIAGVPPDGPLAIARSTAAIAETTSRIDWTWDASAGILEPVPVVSAGRVVMTIDLENRSGSSVSLGAAPITGMAPDAATATITTGVAGHPGSFSAPPPGDIRVAQGGVVRLVVSMPTAAGILSARIMLPGTMGSDGDTRIPVFATCTAAIVDRGATLRTAPRVAFTDPGAVHAGH